MGNVDTSKAILENLQAIVVAEPFKFQLEDLSADPDVSDIPLCLVEPTGVFFEDNFGEKPMTITMTVRVTVMKQTKTPAEHNAFCLETGHGLREALTVAALNTGDLAVSKLVSFIERPSFEMERSPNSVTEMIFNLTIRYREL